MSTDRQHNNSDQQELDNFNRLSNTWWDKEGEFGALHKINPFRLEFIEKHHAIEANSILDIGCGGGILSESLAEKGADVTGIDLAEEVLTVAKLHGLDSGVKVNYELIAPKTMRSKTRLSTISLPVWKCWNMSLTLLLSFKQRRIASNPVVGFSFQPLIETTSLTCSPSLLQNRY